MFTFGGFVGALVLLNSVWFSESATKIWQRNTHITLSENWEDGKLQEECDGLVFPEHVETVVWLDLLETKEIVLQTTGQIFFHQDQNDIVLNERSTSRINCVKLKELVSYDWYDPNNWKNPSLDKNPAVPHLERVPCRRDDVVFPAWEYSGTITFSHFNERVLSFRSFKWGSENWTNNDWNLYGQRGIMKEIFYEPPSVVINENYINSTRHCYNIPLYIVCQHVEYNEDYKCLDPVQPLGFCTEICGAHILLKTDIASDDIRKILEEHSYYSQTHLSEVENGQDVFYQVVFTESDFTGSSLDEAQAFYTKLAQVMGKEVIVSMHKSGPLFVRGKALENALSISLGSLCIVIILLGGLYLSYYSNISTDTLRNRIVNGRPLSNVFATFSRDNVGLHYERHASESSLHLVENFENPMYGKETPASSQSNVTATTTDEVPLQEVEEAKMKETKEEDNENADEE
ncbi:unnamed protein product [Callosobruchus maculatus]|uniref:Protein amnionless n=1 Tax=Callosobruchus maculatus TaxID=64391 RepID=A0A653D3J5_CALMS|nr:unnamed protein product [Callosobruchus maculatus]